MTLEVLISTLGRDGIRRVAAMELPRLENVSYVVSWQMPGETGRAEPPKALSARPDVRIFQSDSLGTSVNRNNAIDRSSADICLIADDDLKYTPGQLSAVIDTFERNPEVELATFMHSGGDDKWYPGISFDLAKPIKGYNVSCVEIAFRRQCGKGPWRFNELFGPGEHPLQAGEENVFLHNAISRGVNCRFFPVVITHHEGRSTGHRTLTPGTLMATGAYIEIAYGLGGIPRLPLFAWRNSRKGRTKLFPAMRHLLRGYIYGKRNFNRDGSTKPSAAG